MNINKRQRFFELFATEAIQAVQKEIEKCWYGKVNDWSVLEGASVIRRIEQWETRCPTGVERVRAYDNSTFELCVKRFVIDAEGNKNNIEKEMDIDEEFFKLYRGLMCNGNVKTRYEFPIADTNMKWEVDVYEDKDGNKVDWVKIDLEIPNREIEIPALPFELEGLFDQEDCTEEQTKFKNTLFDEKYNRSNPNNIKVEFDKAPLDKKTLTVEEIAKKHGVDVSIVESQLEKGIKVEQEHTSDINVAREIASDHLLEFVDYYDRLQEVEKK